MTWMSPSCLQGRGGVNSGHLAEAGGSPFWTRGCSGETRRVRLLLSWMGSGPPGGGTLSLAPWPPFSWDRLGFAVFLAPSYRSGTGLPGIPQTSSLPSSPGRGPRARPGRADMNHLRCLRPPLCPLSL